MLYWKGFVSPVEDLPDNTATTELIVEIELAAVVVIAGFQYGYLCERCCVRSDPIETLLDEEPLVLYPADPTMFPICNSSYCNESNV